MKSWMMVVVLASLVAALATAQSGVSPAPRPLEDSPVTVAAWPTVTVPSGGADADVFQLGAGVGLSAEVALGPRTGWNARLNLGASTLKIKSLVSGTSKDSITELSGGLGAAYELPLAPWLKARFLVDAGVAYGTLAGDPSGGNAYGLVAGGVGLGWVLDPSLSVRLDGGYLYRLGLCGGLTASLALAWALPGPGAVQTNGPTLRPKLLEFTSIRFNTVFPIFQSYYDDHALGTVRLTNTGRQTARNIRVTFLMRQYMDGPKECATLAELKPGESQEIPLYALFRNNILDVTEATKATAEIALDYLDGTSATSDTKTATALVQNRNAMTWDDDRKAAAFVSGKDPWVLDLSNNVIAAVRDRRNTALNANLQTAIAFHSALRQYGLSYVTNPKTPFSEIMKNPQIVDFLKFPRQTLTYRAGDCSDLSILYASLFESVGIETAFVTIPGHIFLAINLGILPENAAKEISASQDLIFRGGKTWLPLELTIRDADLEAIWEVGAQQWRRGVATGSVGFYPVHEAWSIYPPVGLPADISSVDSLNRDRIGKGFQTEVDALAEQERDRRLKAIQTEIKRTGETAKLLNQRGVVNARFGRLDAAGQDFEAARRKAADFAPALVNLGNLALLRGDTKAAYDFYNKAVPLNPQGTAVAARDRVAVILNKSGLNLPVSDQNASIAAPVTTATEPGSRAAEVLVTPAWAEE